MKQTPDNSQSLSRQLKDNSHLLVYLSAAIGFLTPALYLMGLGFHSGYLGVFGSLNSAFPLSVLDAYVYGYFTITLYLADILPYITSMAALNTLIYVVIFLVALAYLAIKVGKYSKSETKQMLPHWLTKTIHFLSPSNNDLTKAIQLASQELSHISKAVYFILVFIVAWVGITLYSSEKGKALAIQTKAAFVQNSCHFHEETLLSNCVTIRDKSGEVLNEGVLIALSGNRYSIFTKKGSVIAELPKGAQIIKAYDYNQPGQ